MTSPLFYLIAGEASGDMLGAGLMQELKLAMPDAQFAGIGGELMQREGLQSLFPMRELSIMGFWEIIPHIPKLFTRMKETVGDIAAKRPTAVITIDSPGFNFRLAERLIKNDATRAIPRIHYVAPSVWAYKPGRAKTVARLFHHLLCLLPFEPPYFENVGLPASFVGHPVLSNPAQGNAAAFRARHNIAPEKSILLVLPGSRMGEIEYHLPTFLNAAATLPSTQIVIMIAPEIQCTPAQDTLCIVSVAEKHDAFTAANLALSKSGTITLELAAAGVPMVVAHKVNPLSAWLLKRMIKIPYVSLANIAADKMIIPELLQEHCNVSEISSALHAMMEENAQSLQKSEMAKAIAVLRGDVQNANRQAAQAVMEALELR